MKVRRKASEGAAILLLLLAVCSPSLAVPQNQEDRNLFASLEGVVIDSRTRQPVAEARVSLERGRGRAPSPEARLSTVTDKRGRFRLDSMEPGVYTLAARKRGYVPSPLHVLELETGKATTREVELDRLSKISGRVVDDAGHAVQGARVAAMVSLMVPSNALQRLLDEHGLAALTATTDGKGYFELLVPTKDGEVTLFAVALGYASNRVGPLRVDAGQERREVVLRLSPGLEMRGRVVEEGGAPLSGATIVAHRLEPARAALGFEEIDPRATSGANGRFLLRGLETGTYTLRVGHATYAKRTVPEIKIESATTQIPDVVLLVQGEISGRVVDATGQPMAGARVRGRAGEEFSQEMVSDSDGRFVLGEFAPGESVRLWAEAAGHSKGEKMVTTPESDVVLVLRPLGVLRGRVEDSDTKGPLREFRIWVARGSEEKTFASEDGSFEWLGLAPGRWTFVAQAPGYQRVEVEGLEIRLGEPTEGVVFTLKKGVELAGRVVDDETGAGLPNVTVSYRDASEPEDPAEMRFIRNKQISDAEGNFKFEGVSPVKITVMASSPLYAMARTTVMAGEQGFVEIRLSTGASLSGSVLASDGVTPVPGAHVSVRSVTSGIGTAIPADGAGVFSFDRLNAGRYRLEAETKFGHTRSQEVALRENERIRGLVLVVKPGATIRGKVSGVVSGELPVVNVLTNGQGGFTDSTLSDADGAYAVHGVPPGLVKVTAATSAVAPSSYRMVSATIKVPEGVQEFVLEIEFPRGSRLYGRVTRAGQPIRFANVSAFPGDPQMVRGFAETDQDGMYAINGLNNGTYNVSVAGMGAKRTVRISGNTILDIELSPR